MIDGDLPNSTVEPFHNEGFEAVHIREVDLGTVSDEKVSAYAGMRPTAFPSTIEEFERIGWESERDVMWYWRDQQSSPRAYQIERGELIFRAQEWADKPCSKKELIQSYNLNEIRW